jgi:ribose transport system substrate-binding protein
VVTFDSDAPLSNRRSYIGTNNLAAGRLCAELVKEAIPEGGKVAVLLANLSKYNLVERKQGFSEELGRSRKVSDDEEDPATYEVIDYFLDDGDDEKCAENIRSVLASHPDVKCLVGMNARHGPILIEVLKEEGKLDEIKLVTFDDAPETLTGIAEGHVHATVAQDPYKYGYEAVRMLATLCRKGELELPVVGGGSVTVYADAIRQDNLEEYRERVRIRKASADE